MFFQNISKKDTEVMVEKPKVGGVSKKKSHNLGGEIEEKRMRDLVVEI
jgi:hypothetical protein